MRVWLCPVKPKSWYITRREKLFGVSTVGRRRLKLVKPGDLLLFYVFRPVNGIVAICSARSKMFENHKDLWGVNRYPYRIRIEPLVEFSMKPIALSSVIGKVDKREGIEIYPYLRGVEIMEILGNGRGKMVEIVKENLT